MWAPHADRVDAMIEGERVGLTRDDHGWWSVEVDLDSPFDYSFSIDGGEPRPDPRSPWQPNGPHGNSRTVAHDTFEWSDGSWRGFELRSAVLYELHVGTFTPEGTFDAAIEKLDHLVHLGVTAVSLMPVAEFAGTRGWGYDGVDLWAPHHDYGGPDALKRFVDTCHQRGLGVVLDVVYNHLGPAGNYLGEFGPYFTDRYTTPWGSAINLDDAYSDEVRDFIVSNAVMWLRDYHIDGLRLDAIHAIVDTSAVHILEDIATAVRALERETERKLWVIAESDLNDPRIVTPAASGGYGIDAQWSDDFHHSLHALLTGERRGYYSDFGSVEHLAKALRQAFVYDGIHSTYRKRRHGRRPGGLSADRFLGYLQTHDQVGNRATGDRSSALMSTAALKLGAALVLTAPFVPMLFQGEEWGASTPFLYFTDHDADLGRAVSAGRKREFAAFGWDPEAIPDPQDPDTFVRSKLDWSEVGDSPHAELLEWHRELIALRRSTPDLLDGDFAAVDVDYGDDWLRLTRGSITVMCNFSADQVDVEITPTS